MSYININDLTFAYEGSNDTIFEHVSIRLDTDWRLGFTGRNGRGKTTFLRLLMDKNNANRRYEYGGTISSSVKFEYFPYAVKNAEANTCEAAEAILPGCMEPGEAWKVFRELSLMEVDGDILYRPFSTLSNGEQTKVLLALLFLRENSFLLIDEPTNHLDQNARESVGEYLKKKSGFILVSHDRALLDTCVDHILSINKAGIEIQKGNFTSWWENKKRQDAFELAENERLKRDVARLKTAAGQAREWADQVEDRKIGRRYAEKYETTKCKGTRAYIGEKSRRMQMHRKNLERRQNRAIEEKNALLKNIEEAEDLKLFPLNYRADRIASFRDVEIAYGRKEVIRGLTFEICRGDRIALVGKNGCGKSSLIKLIIAGLDGVMPEGMAVGGTIEVGGGLTISYVPQNTDFLYGSIQEYAGTRGIDLQLLMTLLRKLDFSRMQFEKKMEKFSEGQKKKVLIAASLASRAHLYLWDEPLNYIDVFSRMQIEELILKYRPTLIFVEHDREFTERIATKKLKLEAPGKKGYCSVTEFAI